MRDVSIQEVDFRTRHWAMPNKKPGAAILRGAGLCHPLANLAA